jgi:hypothetical protein
MGSDRLVVGNVRCNMRGNGDMREKGLFLE